MKSSFVAMVSHELKSPLAIILQQIDVLLEQIVGNLNERQEHFLQRAQDRVEGLVALIDKLLDLSRIESGGTVSQKEPLDLAPVLKQAAESLAPQAERKNQQFVISAPESLPLISADRQNMDEVFMNLISNAIKYTPDEGRIEVNAKVTGSYIQVSVADTGYGIPKNDVPKIFDKFFRVKSDKTKTIEGTGLGLPIVKGIVEAHLGSIKVNSHYGQGTTFTVKLPLIKD